MYIADQIHITGPEIYVNFISSILNSIPRVQKRNWTGNTANIMGGTNVSMTVRTTDKKVTISAFLHSQTLGTLWNILERKISATQITENTIKETTINGKLSVDNVLLIGFNGISIKQLK